jgi:dynein heavy chain, axonemal
MNSVMDDSKILTLASNERIPLKGHMRMIFEIRDLQFASPATVSRAGIIYISTNTGSQWRSLISSWLKKLEASEHIRTTLKSLFERCVDKCYACKVFKSHQAWPSLAATARRLCSSSRKSASPS